MSIFLVFINCIYFSILIYRRKKGKKALTNIFWQIYQLESLEFYLQLIPDSESKPLWNHISLTEICKSEKEKPKAIVWSLLLHFNLGGLLGFPSFQLKVCQFSGFLTADSEGATDGHRLLLVVFQILPSNRWAGRTSWTTQKAFFVCIQVYSNLLSETSYRTISPLMLSVKRKCIF